MALECCGGLAGGLAVRCASELVAVAVLVGVVVVAFASYAVYYNATLVSAYPRLRTIRVYVSQTEVIVNNATITEPTRNFTAKFLYRVFFVVHNAGEDVVSVNYTVLSLRSNVVSVGTNNTSDVLDPLLVSTPPPPAFHGNSVSTFSLIVFSKKNLLLPENSVLALRITCRYADGSTQDVLVVFPR